mgnify:CR=1 FL=1
MVVEVLSRAGAQVPFTPFVEVVGKVVNDCPLQIGATALKVGVVAFFILMFMMSVISFPQLLVAVNVKGNVPIAVLLTT